MRRILTSIAAAAVVVCAAAWGIDHLAGTHAIRQVDAVGRTMPFTVTNPDRWNAQNDGVSFEPCTAFTYTQLVEMRVDPRTVVDASAERRYPNGRGCTWDYASTGYLADWTVTQVVTDTPADDWIDPTPVPRRATNIASTNGVPEMTSMTTGHQRCTYEFRINGSTVATTSQHHGPGTIPFDDLPCTLAGLFAISTIQAINST
ncbi:hypothetical protein nbrc107696_25190 [Gordonia spumicola]|uniref:DUF3558 domain-containing protein n=1 Tax=Gordonia spumicola TaxID=589161 RepID=A0A7I9VAG9_9ACTN|nr:DUF3558 family protein [Gordonia spumicola]GEE02073.1 hypothetical protein nbrc107696_25190 [Gordonia spumicola]